MKTPASSRQGAIQNLAFNAAGGASVQLPTKFGAETYQIRLAATQPVFYLVSENANPVACTAANGALPPSQVAMEYITVNPGQTLTAIGAAASAGVLSVCEVS